MSRSLRGICLGVSLAMIAGCGPDGCGGQPTPDGGTGGGNATGGGTGGATGGGTGGATGGGTGGATGGGTGGATGGGTGGATGGGTGGGVTGGGTGGGSAIFDGGLTAHTPNDPLFASQWHLSNTGQMGQNGVAATTGEDLNVMPVWGAITGAGVRIAVLDDGLDIDHEDLSPNVVPNQSWDYSQPNGGAYGNPSGTTGSHGTSCGGLAAARGDNNLGVTGVAFNARMVGYNLLAMGSTNNASGSHAVTLDLASNDVYSNSYGAADATGAYFDSDSAWQAAITTGITTGRGGKGAVYTWAAGNGAGGHDRSDYDGQANFFGVLAIGALNSQGQKSSYSEEGANLLVMAYGGEFCDTQQVVTTDITAAPGYNNGSSTNDITGQANYTRCFNGTSAATPEATGVVALMLSANPNLTWRDVRYILATTARRNDMTDTDWVQNRGGAGHFINHKYGYGVVNATAAVTRAVSGYMNLPALVNPAALTSTTVAAIPDNTGAAVTQTAMVSASGITKLEFVDVTVTSNHTDVGDLAITLTSPSGTVRTLATQHACQTAGNTPTPAPCGAWAGGTWRFGISQLIDEPADGTWTLTVRDSGTAGTGSLNGWSLNVAGH